MIRQAILPSFDDQLRYAVRRVQTEKQLTQLEVAKAAGIMPGVISAWIRNPSKTIRLHTAESLARVTKTELRTTRIEYSLNDPQRSLLFEEQFQPAISNCDIRVVSQASGIPISRLESWAHLDGSKLLLSDIFLVCLILEVDLLVSKNEE